MLNTDRQFNEARLIHLPGQFSNQRQSVDFSRLNLMASSDAVAAETKTVFFASVKMKPARFDSLESSPNHQKRVWVSSKTFIYSTANFSNPKSAISWSVSGSNAFGV
jgi:hypothetical protein